MEITENSSHAPWYVVRVKANAERKVAQAVSAREFEVFLPMQVRRGGRKGTSRVETPLFPGYVFARFECGASLAVLMCPGVVHILCRGSVPEPVDPVEMHALQSVTRLAQLVEPLPTFAIGQKVRISGGPLADVEGIVLRDNGRQRLAVSISLLHRSVVAEVEREWIENLKAPIEVGQWARSAV
jgi:transcriptional antiterminator NusG